MKVIGVTGGSGAGKTTVLELLRGHGAFSVDCDRLYDGLLRSSDALRRDLERECGAAFLPDGSLDRAALRERVFSDPDALRRLNGVVFYHVGVAVREELKAAKKDGYRLAAIDAVNLIESGLGELCDTTVAVLAPREKRIERITARDGISREQAVRRIDAQQSDETFTAHCKITLQNDGDPAQLREKAETALAEYLKEE